MYFEKHDRINIWAFSVFIAIILYFLIFSEGVYIPTKPYLIPINQKVNNILVLVFLTALIPPTIMEVINNKWLYQVEENIPILLRDVTETVRSGVPLVRALEEASTRDYGPISKSLEMTMVKFNLTSDFHKVFTWFGEKLKKPSAKRMSSILIEAYNSGGKMFNALVTSVEIFSSLVEYRKEKSSQMKPYIFVAYLGTFVFLTISYVVLVRFLVPLTAVSNSPLEGQVTLFKNILDINYYKSILFWAAVLETIFGGLIAGKMSEGSIKAGLIHSVILLIITIIFFNSFKV